MSESRHARLQWPGSPYLSSDQLEAQARALRGLGFEVSTSRDRLEDLSGIDLLVTSSKALVDASLVATADRLAMIVTATSGFDHLDLAALGARGVVVARCPLARRDAVVATALALGLSFLRGLPALGAAARAGRWARAELPGMALRTLSSITVGLLGYGVIGARAAEAWSDLGASILIHDPARPDPGPAPLDIAAEADIVSLHCSLTESSRRMVNEEFLDAMKPGAILLNTARGECVDEDALARAHHLGGIGLDVFSREPWDGPHPLAQDPRVQLLPHAAGYHAELGANLTAEIEAAVNAWVRGHPVPHAL